MEGDTVQSNVGTTNPYGVSGDVLSSAIDNFGGVTTANSDPWAALAASPLYGGTDPLYAVNGAPLVSAPAGLSSLPNYLWWIAGAVVLLAVLKR